MKKIICIIIFILFTQIIFAQARFIRNPNNTITLNLEKVPIKDALKWLSKFSNKNIVIDQSVQGNITIFLKKLTWQETMQAVLRSQKLAQKEIGKVIYIVPQDEIAKQQKIIVKPLHTLIMRLNYAKAFDIAKLLTGKKKSLLSAQGYVATDKRTNSLIVNDTNEQLKIIRNFIYKLDIPVRQVLIEARIVNIDEDYEQDLGIRFKTTVPSNVSKMGHLNIDLPGVSNNAAHIGVALMKLAKGTLLDLELSALESADHATVISNPHLITANQQTATIEAGEEIPYQESAGQGTTSTAFKKAVLRLQVTPQIAPNNKIILHLQVQQDKCASKEVLGVPAIDTRQISTQVLINNGHTIVLGGVYEHTKTNSVDRVPFFGNLPVIGALFKHKKVVDNRRELLIFVTPTIILSQKV